MIDIPIQGTGKRRDGLGASPQSHQRQGQVIVKGSGSGVGGDGPADQGNGIFMTAPLLGDQPGQMQGLGVLRIILEHALVQAQCVIQLATGVVGHRLAY